MGVGSGGGGGGWSMLGVNGLFGVEADGRPSSVVQPPLLKPDVGRGGLGTTWDSSEDKVSGCDEGGSCEVKTVAHPAFLKLLPEERLPTEDQPPVLNPDFFSGGVGPGSMPGVGIGTNGVKVLSFTPAALAAFRNSFSSLFLSFSLRLSIASWEFALARSFDCISLNRIL
jgi:hypothetical protein